MVTVRGIVSNHGNSAGVSSVTMLTVRGIVSKHGNSAGVSSVTMVTVRGAIQIRTVVKVMLTYV